MTYVGSTYLADFQYHCSYFYEHREDTWNSGVKKRVMFVSNGRGEEKGRGRWGERYKSCHSFSFQKNTLFFVIIFQGKSSSQYRF